MAGAGCRQGAPFDQTTLVFKAGLGEATQTPIELKVGFLVEEFKKLPHEFGYGDSFDYATLERCRYAVFTYRTGQMYLDLKHNLDRFTPSQWAIINQVVAVLKTESENGIEDDGY